MGGSGKSFGLGCSPAFVFVHSDQLLQLGDRGNTASEVGVKFILPAFGISDHADIPMVDTKEMVPVGAMSLRGSRELRVCLPSANPVKFN